MMTIVTIKNVQTHTRSEMKILVLSPHTDDEFGCAGTIAKWSKKHDIEYVAFSRCEESVPKDYPPATLEYECRECIGRLGIKMRSIFGFKVRNFPAARQEILECMVNLKKICNPNLVLMPASTDTHQDHQVIFKEGFRAFKKVSILGYELPQNIIKSTNTAFVKLNREHMKTKMHALSAYESQRFRGYASEAFIYGLATVRGVQCEAEYAESFEVIRLMI